jgi:hypothetical protein
MNTDTQTTALNMGAFAQKQRRKHARRAAAVAAGERGSRNGHAVNGGTGSTMTTTIKTVSLPYDIADLSKAVSVNSHADLVARVAELENMLRRVLDECAEQNITADGIVLTPPCLLTHEQARAALAAGGAK